MTDSTASGIRAFIALTIPRHGRQALIESQKKLKAQVARGSTRWVDENGFHLTLFFLGDGIEPSRVAALCDVVEAVAAVTAPFALSLGPLGCFPDVRRPKVLWTGFEGGVAELQALKSRVDAHVGMLGWKPENRAYRPHLTLGRVKDQMGVVNSELPYGQPLAVAEWTASALHLYRSQFAKNRGPVYTRIHSATFSL